MTGSTADSINLIATTAFGLEAVVRRELAQLGYEGRVIGPGWIRFAGDERAIARTNLWLRCADRVLIEVATFAAVDFEALFETTKSLDWGRWIPPDGSFPVVGRSLKSQLSSVPACQRAVKKAIVESLLAGHSVAELPETGATHKVEVALLKDQATLTLDTTGPSLHKRGYRPHNLAAPLKETLAAALVMLSFWRPERPFIDPFCGSGTIPIEAAMIGMNLAPGGQREFAAEGWSSIPSTAWSEARDEAAELAVDELPERLIGGDVDALALKSARANAERAGVFEQVHFQQRPFEQLTSRREHGCLITNPPYGRRLGELDELAPLYESIPRVLRGLPTWSHYILTAYPSFERLIQKEADRRRKLYNGRIECTYYQFHGPKASPRAATTSADDDGAVEQKPAAAATAPVFGGLTAKAREQAELFAARLRKRARHLRRWPTRKGVTCYRLYERDVPEIPLVVDCYEDHLHVSEYERPHDRDLAQHADWLDLMADTAAEALELDRRNVFLKRRIRQRGAAQHERQSRGPTREVTVGEGGLKFLVNLSDYVDTGLFLDHRVTREMVRGDASGKRFLNLFGYTGSFSVYAAAGGASETITVDWSTTYLDWARRNMALNGFEGPAHQFVAADAREFVQSQKAGQFDLAVVDPPTFSNSKRTDEDWEVQRGHADLLRRVLRTMRTGGVIYFSTNFRRFKLDEAALADCEFREISRQTVPEDFRNRRIHRCWRIVAP